jgi:hypothetical protein
MSKHIIEYDCECESCNATGLYVGFAEKCGSAVVCYNCGGTGKKHVKFSYNDFVKKRVRKNVKRVVQVNPGISIGARKTEKYGQLTLEDFGGMPYKDWLAGKPFPKQSEMRRFTCPAWWYQCANYKRKPEWKECGWGGSFSDCEHFGDKATCWKRWDKENR